MKIFVSMVAFCCVFLFSGCSLKHSLSYFIPDTIAQNEITLTLKGTIEESNALFSSYVFVSENGVMFDIETVDAFSQDLAFFSGKEVVVKGLMSNLKTDKETQKISFVQTLHLIDIALFVAGDKEIYEWDEFSPQYFTLHFSFPYTIEVQEKILHDENHISPQSRIIAKYNNDFFFTITSDINEGWRKKFKEDGNLVMIGDMSAYRLFSGEQILFYIPDLNIQIDYWGENEDIHLFYSIIKTIKERKEEKNTQEETEQEAEEEKNNRKINTPEIDIVILNLLNNKQEILEESSESAFIIIDNIEAFGQYLSVEYHIVGSNPTDSVLDALFKKKLFALEWKDKNKNDFYVQSIVEWKRGEYNLWEVVSGNVPMFPAYKHYFLRNIHTKFILPQSADFLVFFSPEYKYSLKYPKKMYYEIVKNNDTIETVIWSNSPSVSRENFDMKLSLKSDGIDEYSEDFSENIIFIPKSNSAHFVLEGSSNIKFSFLQKMAKSIVLY